MYDISRRDTYEHLNSWLDELDRYWGEEFEGRPLARLLVGNKADLDPHGRQVEFSEARQFAEQRHLPFLEVSARQNFHVREAFECIARQALQLQMQTESAACAAGLPLARVQSTVALVLPSAVGLPEPATFREAVHSGLLPRPDQIHDSALLADYVLHPPQPRQQQPLAEAGGRSPPALVSSLGWAASKDCFSSQMQYFIIVRLGAQMDGSEPTRRPLRLALALCPLDAAARLGPRGRQSRLEVLKETLMGIVSRLSEHEQLAVLSALQPGQVQVLHPLEFMMRSAANVKQTLLALQAPVPNVISRDAAARSLKLFRQAVDLLSPGASADYESRVVLVLDRFSGLEDHNAESRLIDLVRRAAKSGVYTSLVVLAPARLSSDLRQQLQQIRGACMLQLSSGAQLQQLFLEEMELFCWPVLQNVSLRLEAVGWRVVSVQGPGAVWSPSSSTLSGTELFRAASLFSSRSRSRSASSNHGGVLVVRVERVPFSNQDEVQLVARWEAADGSECSSGSRMRLEERDQEAYSDLEARKAVLLCRYSAFTRLFASDAATGFLAPEIPSAVEKGLLLSPQSLPHIAPPSPEKQHSRLCVSERWKPLVVVMAAWFSRELREIGDATLEQDLGVLHRLANAEVARRAESGTCCT